MVKYCTSFAIFIKFYNLKVFVTKEIPVTSGIVPYIVNTAIDIEIINGLPVTSEFQTIADLLSWRDVAKMSRQIPIEAFAMLFESDNPYPKERELEGYLDEKGLMSQYRQLREECKVFYDY